LNITLDKHTSTDGLIKIKLTESDYQPKVEEKVKEYARKANIKGFRQGKVPGGVIRKMFGKSILVEEVNHLISHSVSDYIKNNKLNVLGDPLPNQEKAQAIDWDHQKDFEFEFQVGLVDDFTYELSSKVKVKSHPIEVDEKTINETIADLRKRFGDVSNPEVSETGDTLFGDLSAEGSEEKKNVYLSLEKVSTEELGKFTGLKKEDVVRFDIDKAFKESSEKAKFLGLSEEEAKSVMGNHSLTVTNISRVTSPEINQEFFDKVFGKDAVKTEEEFRNKVEMTIGENYKRESDHLLEHEIQHQLVDHTKMNLPDAFLKSWLKNTSEGKVTDEIIEKDFNDYRNSLKWDLIKNKIAEDHNIKVEANEVKERARQLIMEQFGGQAFAAQLGDKLDAIADNYLSGEDGKVFMKLYNQLRAEKIIKFVKETITISEKPVSLDEFKKIAEQHHH
jgi:trigger factor